jgi:carboxyl-terminal processing protease
MGILFNPGNRLSGSKVSEIQSLIENSYVDTVNDEVMEQAAIEGLLSSLDPHSVYIPAEDLVTVNEPLEGNFQGIGIEFNLIDDTIYVVSAINGGPAEKAGVKPGDKFVKINGGNYIDKGMTNEKVVKLLKGKAGTEVKVTILRKGMPKLLDVTITRGTIPLHSANIYYMIKPGTGYLKITRFADNTLQEFRQGLYELKKKGMQRLVLDLRGNPGGYLDPAIRIADEFLDGKKLIVYTQGKHQPRDNRHAEIEGGFETGNIAVLIDEGSASASEVLAGALQDWDRATIIGRRSFGKGLVQEPFTLSDGSAIRLTIARYYTPTGRSIQKPYEKGKAENYNEDLLKRFRGGELQYLDSVKQNTTQKFVTPGGKTVYGGGGIMPDIFVALDTNRHFGFLNEAFSKNIVNEFVNGYLEGKREEINNPGSADEYSREHKWDEGLYNSFIEYAVKNGVTKKPENTATGKKVIIRELKANIAHQLWGITGYNMLLNQGDATVLKAVETLEGK